MWIINHLYFCFWMLIQQRNYATKLQNIDKLTALWALSESGLGGILHAYRLPFSGFFLAAFAIIIIRYISFLSDNSFKTIVKATIIVLMVKAIASPQSPINAYIAVSFQGFIGAIIFSLIKKQKIATYLTAIICLMETALQKLLVVWILFGSSLFIAFDRFTEDVLKEFHLGFISSITYLVFIYLSIYFLWAIYIGHIANQLPDKVYERFLSFKAAAIEMPIQNNHTNKIINKIKYLGLLLVLFLMLAFAILLKSDILLASFYRTILILSIWILVSPLLKWALLKWIKGKKNYYTKDVFSILEMFPKLKTNIKPSLALAKKNAKGIGVYKEFIYNLIAMNIYEK